MAQRFATPGFLALGFVALAILATLLAPTAGAQQALEVTTLVPDLEGAVGGVAVDRLGYVYVADFGNKVWRVAPWGEVEVLASGLYGTSGNAIDGEGRLLQSSFHGNALFRVGRDGGVERLADGFQGPVGVAVGGDGEIYVTNCVGNWIAKVSPAAAEDGQSRENTEDGGGESGEEGGEEGAESGSGEAAAGAWTVSEHARSDLFLCPNGITRDPRSGDLYVLNFRDTRILKVAPEGEATLFATLPGTGGGHLVWTPQGLYATTFRGHRLHHVSMQGEVETVAGSGRFAVEDGSGEAASFASPNGIAWDPARGFLYVNDYPVPWLERATTRPTSALRRIALPSLTQVLQEGLAAGGVEGMETAYRHFRQDHKANTEAEMNRLGYNFLAQGEAAAGLRAFELNAAAYPGSANAWDSLAEAHERAGRRERAIELYRKVLEIDAENAHATQKLQELGGR